MTEDEEIMSIETGSELDIRVANEFMSGALKNYSKDISAAWQVVKKLEALDWRVDIITSNERKSVYALKMVNGAPHTLHFKFGHPMDFSSIPEGICKVSLLTLIIERNGW